MTPSAVCAGPMLTRSIELTFWQQALLVAAFLIIAPPITYLAAHWLVKSQLPRK